MYIEEAGRLHPKIISASLQNVLRQKTSEDGQLGRRRWGKSSSWGKSGSRRSAAVRVAWARMCVTGSFLDMLFRLIFLFGHPLSKNKPVVPNPD